jgi:hypothetical protein
MPRVAGEGDILVTEDGDIQVYQDGAISVDNEAGGCCCNNGSIGGDSADGGGDEDGDGVPDDLSPIPCSEPLGNNYTVAIGGGQPKTCTCGGDFPDDEICPPFGTLQSIITSAGGGAFRFREGGPTKVRNNSGSVRHVLYDMVDTEACDDINTLCVVNGCELRMGGNPLAGGLWVGVPNPGTCNNPLPGPPVDVAVSEVSVASFIVVCRAGFWLAGYIDALGNFIEGFAQPGQLMQADSNISVRIGRQP